MIRNVLLALCVLSCSACATVIRGTTQKIAVMPMEGSLLRTDVPCAVESPRGRWIVPNGESVRIPRSRKPLQVSCSSATTSVRPKFSGGFLALDILTGPFTPTIVDLVTGALYSYPPTVRVDVPPAQSAER